MNAFRRAVPWLTVAATIVTLAGCFSPREAPCAFTCIAADARCPENYVCGDDGLCHRANAADEPGICLLKAPDPGAGGAGGQAAPSN